MKILNISFVFASFLTVAYCAGPLARLFNLKNFNPDTATFIVNARDEDRFGQDCFAEGQKADSVCVNGTWLFYPDDFLDTTSTTIPFMISDTCENFKAELSKKVSSYRSANDPDDVDAEVLTLYQEKNYRGEEQKIVIARGGQIENVNINFTSFIASSELTRYEFCQREDGQGLCVCIYTEGGRAIEDIGLYLGLAAGDVKSVMRDCRSGCFASKKIREEL